MRYDCIFDFYITTVNATIVVKISQKHSFVCIFFTKKLVHTCSNHPVLAKIKAQPQ